MKIISTGFNNISERRSIGGFLAIKYIIIMRSILPLLLLISSALTGETDNYYSMNQNIKDSSELINEEFNRRLYNSLESINNRPDLQSMECSEIAGDLLKSFGVTLATRFESWIHQNNEIEKYPPAPLKRKKYFKKSIYYENTFNPLHRHLDFMIWTQFDPVINIGDVYIGTDKITHFTASGYLYYKRYLNALKNGLSREDAALKSIRKGITSEKLILGVTSNGIFSYADLESNYQGMQLGIDLCSGDDPLLNKSDGKWRLEGEIDL
ncbi:MAG: hypothetical protein ACE5D7_04455, partial [Fidelibacterota bacterium]